MDSTARGRRTARIRRPRTGAGGLAAILAGAHPALRWADGHPRAALALFLAFGFVAMTADSWF